MTTDLMQRGQQALQNQAFSRLLGAELSHFEPGSAHLRLPLRPDHLQQHGIVHGGVIAYLADNALTFAGGSVLGDCLTAEWKINYLRPARDADALVAEAQVLGSGRSQAVCRCDVYAQRADGRVLCAAAQGTIRRREA
ncbi:MAG: PaaI family thioesterase [Rubrivivax sp.]